MLLAVLQLHMAHPDNLTHEAYAGPDEVCTAEVLQEQRAWVSKPMNEFTYLLDISPSLAPTGSSEVFGDCLMTNEMFTTFYVRRCKGGHAASLCHLHFSSHSTTEHCS